MSPTLSRRSFLALGACTAAHATLGAQTPGMQPSGAHANVAELDRANIVADARAALSAPIQPPGSPDFHTEIEPNVVTAGALPRPRLVRTDAVALQNVSATVAALAAGFLLTRDDAYAQRAVAHVQAWFVTPATRLNPTFDQAGCAIGTSTGTPAGVIDLVPLAEVARALSFFSDALTPADLATIQTWFTNTQHWLNDNRQAYIARESKDHRASAHLLISSAVARFLRDETVLEDCRKRFRVHTLRNQVRSDGVFPQEVASPNPYRNTLFNFDLLGGACQLLSSQFDLLWDHELIDGVGMRIVAAYLYPVIAHPERWGFPADAQHFRDLPGRRPALLFSGRAYSRPEYVELWRSLPAAPPVSIAETFPIRQPALWTARAPHGF